MPIPGIKSESPEESPEKTGNERVHPTTRSVIDIDEARLTRSK